MVTNTFESQLKKTGTMGFSGCDISLVVRLPAYKVAGKQEQTSEKVYKLGTLQTLSISTYNAKTPVKSLGFKNPIAIARGGRTIAGTMILNQMHSHVFDENNYGPGGWMKYDDDGFLTYSSGNVEYFIQRAEDVVKSTSETKSKLEKMASKGQIPVEPGETDADAIRKFYKIAGRDIEKTKKQWDYSWDTSLLGQRTKPSDLPPFDIIILLLNEAGNAGKIILYGVEIVHDSQTLSVEDIYTEVQYQYIARDIEYFENMDVINGFAKNNVLALANELTVPGFSNKEINELAAKNVENSILAEALANDSKGLAQRRGQGLGRSQIITGAEIADSIKVSSDARQDLQTNTLLTGSRARRDEVIQANDGTKFDSSYVDNATSKFTSFPQPPAPAPVTPARRQSRRR